MIAGAKGLNPYELAHIWVNDLLTPTSSYNAFDLEISSKYFCPIVLIVAPFLDI